MELTWYLVLRLNTLKEVRHRQKYGSDFMKANSDAIFGLSSFY